MYICNRSQLFCNVINATFKFKIQNGSDLYSRGIHRVFKVTNHCQKLFDPIYLKLYIIFKNLFITVRKRFQTSTICVLFYVCFFKNSLLK